jgi:hypothetical protein
LSTLADKAVEVLGDPLKRLNYNFTLAKKPSEPHVPRPEPSVPREKPFQSENVNNTPKPQVNSTLPHPIWTNFVVLGRQQ